MTQSNVRRVWWRRAVAACLRRAVIGRPLFAIRCVSVCVCAACDASAHAAVIASADSFATLHVVLGAHLCCSRSTASRAAPVRSRAMRTGVVQCARARPTLR